MAFPSDFLDDFGFPLGSLQPIIEIRHGILCIFRRQARRFRQGVQHLDVFRQPVVLGQWAKACRMPATILGQGRGGLPLNGLGFRDAVCFLQVRDAVGPDDGFAVELAALDVLLEALLEAERAALDPTGRQSVREALLEAVAVELLFQSEDFVEIVRSHFQSEGQYSMAGLGV